MHLECGGHGLERQRAFALLQVDHGLARQRAVNIRLSDEELNEVDKLLPKADSGTLVECLDRLLEVGKVSFNWQKGSMNITLTVMEGKQAGYAVSAFSDSLNEAILILSVKVRNYLDSFSEIYSKGGTRTRRG